MNSISYTSGNKLSIFSSYAGKYSYEQNKEVLIEVLSESVDKIETYLAFKKKMDEEERLLALNKPNMSFTDVRKAIKNRESKITHFIETLTDNQVTLLYLLFQTGADIQGGTTETKDDVYRHVCRYIDSDFNFSHTNNRQFKLSYFHDYLFTRRDAAENVKTALKGLGIAEE